MEPYDLVLTSCLHGLSSTVQVQVSQILLQNQQIMILFTRVYQTEASLFSPSECHLDSNEVKNC